MRTIRTKQNILYIGSEAAFELNKFLLEGNYSSLFVLADENTKSKCLPKIKKAVTLLQKAQVITIKSGEKNKNINSCIKIWNELSKHNTDRNSLLVNLGGGVITDMGGFAASAYKRGIDFINIPTTLLAQVDASVGGKTGIDFNQFKNQVGTFAFAEAVFIFPELLKTLSKRELISGFAEVIKHGLIADKQYWNAIKKINPLQHADWEELIGRSVEIKNKVVEEDPYEKGLRKILNFGHTVGHALESFSMQKDKKSLLHGEAIAAGMICETYLSRKYCGLKNEELNEVVSYISSVFHPKAITFPSGKLIGLMYQDKKNTHAEINFSLLSAIGKAEINISCSEELIEESLNFFNSCCK